MRFSKSTGFSFRFMSLALITVFGAAQAQDAQTVEKPGLKIGDSWSYLVLEPISKAQQSTIDLVVSEVSETQLKMTNKSSEVIAIYDADFAATNLAGVAYSPSIRALSFPMAAGKKWEHTNTRSHPTCGKSITELKNEVIGWEDVKVPAGTFRALRIDSDGNWRNSCGSGKLTYRFWYAPKVKWLVKSDSRVFAGGQLFDGSIRELTSFKIEESK